MSKRSGRTLLPGLLWVMASVAHAAPPVEWNVDGRGRLKGSGCDTLAHDTFLIEAGEQFFIVFNRLEVQLDAGNGRKAEATCTGSIPIAVHTDRYLDRLEQTLSYSWSKSTGATARIAARNKWYGRALSPLHVNLQSWESGAQPFNEIFTRDDLKWGCKPNDVKKGTLDLDFAVSAQRSHPAEETIAVNLVGHDIRYTARTVWKDCPN